MIGLLSATGKDFDSIGSESDLAQELAACEDLEYEVIAESQEGSRPCVHVDGRDRVGGRDPDRHERASAGEHTVAASEAGPPPHCSATKPRFDDTDGPGRPVGARGGGHGRPPPRQHPHAAVLGEGAAHRARRARRQALSLEQMHTWEHRQTASCNWAIATGAPTGPTVLDIDSPERFRGPVST